MRIDKILEEVENEFQRATELYPSFHSNHEGYAVIHEELDEVWDAVKASKEVKGNKQIRHELIQVAAMAVRFLHDLC